MPEWFVKDLVSKKAEELGIELKAEGGTIGGGTIQGQDMGDRTGFYKPKLITDKRSPHKGEYSIKFPGHTKTVQDNPKFKGTHYGDKTKIQGLIDKYTKLAEKSSATKDDKAKTRVRNQNFKNLVDDIIEKGDLSVFKSNTREAGGIIPNDWMTKIFNPAINAGKNSPEMKQLAEILERSEDEILELNNVREGQVKDYKIKYIDTRKALAATDKNKLKFLDIVDSSDQINLKGVAKQLGLSQTATNDLINSVYKDIYSNTTKLGRGETNLVRYLPKAQTPLRDLLRSMNKIEGVDKIERRTINDLLDRTIGFKAAKKYQNSDLYKLFKSSINEYYKLKDVLPEGLKLNLDHPLSMKIINQLGSDFRLQKINVSPITQELNLGLKAQFDKAYGNSLKNNNTKAQRAIEKIANQIELPMTKVGKPTTDPTKFSFITEDIKSQILSSLENQNRVAKNIKNIDPNLLKAAGMEKYKLNVPEVPKETIDAVKNLVLERANQKGIKVTNSQAGFITNELLGDIAKVGGKVLKGAGMVGGAIEPAFAAMNFSEAIDAGLSGKESGLYTVGKFGEDVANIPGILWGAKNYLKDKFTGQGEKAGPFDYLPTKPKFETLYDATFARDWMKKRVDATPEDVKQRRIAERDFDTTVLPNMTMVDDIDMPAPKEEIETAKETFLEERGIKKPLFGKYANQIKDIKIP